MYLHLGGDRLVLLSQVVAIMEAGSSAMRAYAARAEAEGKLDPCRDGQVHAYVVTRDRVYASAISAATLQRRAVLAGRGLLNEG
ncbi:extracellular matrix regulator RemB [Limnochorda pilosa]|uniref:DUF370 domain-containing protein n=1 Tax=Limnochorda pilosa TaxID=1555112 RepID=A0A0K2SFJ5_LIMPI|nr:extracellular matrix/biofilm biosynthesis regulator RemA family protein [Limnochorda pilosa]BAS25866.1 hypothetical protein LIP_0005 [Limnochorda pilosa]